MTIVLDIQWKNRNLTKPARLALSGLLIHFGHFGRCLLENLQSFPTKKKISHLLRCTVDFFPLFQVQLCSSTRKKSVIGSKCVCVWIRVATSHFYSRLFLDATTQTCFYSLTPQMVKAVNTLYDHWLYRLACTVCKALSQKNEANMKAI